VEESLPTPAFLLSKKTKSIVPTKLSLAYDVLSYLKHLQHGAVLYTG